MNATEATSTEEDNRQRGIGNAGRCSKQASKQESLLTKWRYHGKTGGGGPSKKQSKSPVSVRKVETIRKHGAGDIQGYRLLDITILKDILMGLSCPESFEVGSLSLLKIVTGRMA